MEEIYYILKKIAIKEFAINEEMPTISEGSEISLSLRCKFSYAKERHNVLCEMMVEYKLGEIQLLKSTIETIFNIHPDCYAMVEKDGKTVLPKGLLLPLASTTYGTLRGILFAKTADTELQTLFLPLADMSNVVKSDLTFA